jgi:peptidoglycan-N-acetylglucosamine deacetylase
MARIFRSSLLIFLALAALAAPSCSRKKPTTARPGGSPTSARPQNGPPVGSPAPGTVNRYNKVANSRNFIAITFDDGPAPSTPRLLDMLAQRNIKATFFVIGQSAAAKPNVIRRIVADGHEIANHTWTHPALSGLSDAGVRKELGRSHEALVNMAGAAPRMYRPPGGAITERQRQWILSEFGYPTIMWTVDPRDWEPVSRGGTKNRPDLLTQRILRDTTSGAIVLVHDLHASSVDAMPATLDGLLARGFRFLTMSQLLALNQQGGPSVVTAKAEASLPFSTFTPGSF